MITQVIHRQNVVATCALIGLGKKLTTEELRRFTLSVRNAEFRPKTRFSTVVTVRLRKLRVTGLIFNSGKIVVNGASSIVIAKKACRQLARLIQKSIRSTVTSIKSFKVENIVFSGNFNQSLDLADLYNHHYCQFEPELFPGMVYRSQFKNQNVTVLLFKSGKFVITGLKTDNEDHLSDIMSLLLTHLWK